MMKDAGAVGSESLRVVFDDERVVSDAGIALVATLAGRLAIEGLVSRLVGLRGDRPGAANAGRKVLALIFAMLLGADSIDDCELLRAGRTRRLLGGWLPAPSTLGTFLRAFTFGHVRQLDRVLAEALTRAWRAGAGPGPSASWSMSTASSARSTATGSRARGSGTQSSALPPAARRPRASTRDRSRPSIKPVSVGRDHVAACAPTDRQSSAPKQPAKAMQH
jgi:hypothetical protein